MPGGLTSIPTTVAFLLAAAGLNVSIAAMAFETRDIVAVTGALLAAAVAMLEAKEKGRPLRYQISVMLSSVAIGSTVPGWLIGWKWPEMFATLSWHGWGFFGFIAGLCGWSLVYGILKTAQRKLPAAIDQGFNRVVPSLETPNPDDQKTLEDSRKFRADMARRRRNERP